MLLRSSSTPILNSWYPHSKDSSPEPEVVHQIPRNRSITLSASSSSLSRMDDSVNKMTRALSETDLLDLSVPKKKPFNQLFGGLSVEDEEQSKVEKGFNAYSRTASFGRGLFSFSELDEESEICLQNDGMLGVLVGGGIGGGGGRICGGGGGGGSDNGDSNHGSESVDMYYQTMIEANPGNSLLLSNYAKYLKEVRGDYVKAEEYCSRAILANPNDGNVLSMYADLIWEGHKDASRAETYFDQAVKAAPDDCYVLASYAHFLWDAEEDDDVAEEDASEKTETPSFFHGAPPPLAAAS
ncbi:Signal transduction response regulator [Senna tora]|uniref:Signal transduction response regulator n=1 Tax=Senna tora TaxID=362788 RepID=A0A834SL26_9FABA|nr:Signal transduction response regulator [Senna tora]